MTYTFAQLFDLAFVICPETGNVVVQPTDFCDVIRIDARGHLTYGYLNSDAITPLLTMVRCENGKIDIKEIGRNDEVSAYKTIDSNTVLCSTDDGVDVLWSKDMSSLIRVDCDACLISFMKGYNQLIEFMRTKHITTRRCRNCGKLFASMNRNQHYCDGAGSDGKPCVSVGPANTWKDLLDSDVALKCYNRAYKAHFARKKKGIMSEDEFQAWRWEAKRMLASVRAGELDITTYCAWLKI